jgi:hypothetical protein
MMTDHRCTDSCDVITSTIPQIRHTLYVWNRAYAAGDKNLGNLCICGEFNQI